MNVQHLLFRIDYLQLVTSMDKRSATIIVYYSLKSDSVFVHNHF